MELISNFTLIQNTNWDEYYETIKWAKDSFIGYNFGSMPISVYSNLLRVQWYFKNEEDFVQFKLSWEIEYE